MANRRCAEWRFPTDKQAQAEATARHLRAAGAAVPLDAVPTSVVSAAGPGDTMPESYWDAVLGGPVGRSGADTAIQNCRLSEIPFHLLRVSCRRCDRLVEIQTADAVRLYGRQTTWKEAGNRLLDDGCRQRTGSRDDDGCWPNFDNA